MTCLMKSVYPSLFAITFKRYETIEAKSIYILGTGCAAKERQMNYYLAQGRGISIEDLITENDRRYDDNEDMANFDQERLQIGYNILIRTLPWLRKTSSDMEHDKYMRMLKMLRQGADGARGDNTSKQTLIADWVNRELKSNSLVDPDDKHSRGFINDACGKLLCPAELDWNSPITKAGIQDRSEGYIVTDLSFPAFLYEKYTANLENLDANYQDGESYSLLNCIHRLSSTICAIFCHVMVDCRW
ncbi:hypothetical protein DFJ58DRAFT_841222 [Suillus subalutaceus]|uniref:uncharacterized protein n=1 Tax=Suillus subalutaceus TaxID=48586 RepID=UPI001B872915|nr:uncharacterized protein DFJ58DRAFT_841222 [Suillus subalutaceus]KAG1855217.1 hypothetical protein DFJ58DRAFT_841222 [Suillus subalutaceus]